MNVANKRMGEKKKKVVKQQFLFMLKHFSTVVKTKTFQTLHPNNSYGSFVIQMGFNGGGDAGESKKKKKIFYSLCFNDNKKYTKKI